jgi:hypothetical protein
MVEGWNGGMGRTQGWQDGVNPGVEAVRRALLEAVRWAVVEVGRQCRMGIGGGDPVVRIRWEGRWGANYMMEEEESMIIRGHMSMGSLLCHLPCQPRHGLR